MLFVSVIENIALWSRLMWQEQRSSSRDIFRNTRQTNTQQIPNENLLAEAVITNYIFSGF